MTQIVINRCHGGFGLSDAAVELYAQLVGITLVSAGSSFGSTNYYRDRISNANYFSSGNIPRDCSHLVQVVEQLGEAANTRYSTLKVVEVPDDVEWQIEEYDGLEWVSEAHRTWS